MFIYNHCLWCDVKPAASSSSRNFRFSQKVPLLWRRKLQNYQKRHRKKGSEIECYLSLKHRSIWDFRVGMFFWVALHTWHLRSSDNRLLFPDISSTLPANSTEARYNVNNTGLWSVVVKNSTRSYLLLSRDKTTLIK